MTVYFLECDGFVKIGYTEADTPDSRVSSMRTGNPHPITVLAYGAGECNMENALHKEFADYRHHGEWFTPCDDLARVINYVRTMRTTRGLFQYLGISKPHREVESALNKQRLEDLLKRNDVYRPRSLSTWADVRHFTFGHETELELGALILTADRAFSEPSLIERRFTPLPFQKESGAGARDLTIGMLADTSDERLAYWVLAGLEDAKNVECGVDNASELRDVALSVFSKTQAPSWHWKARDLTLYQGDFLAGARVTAQEFLLLLRAIRYAFLARYWIVVPTTCAPAWLQNSRTPTWSHEGGGTIATKETTEVANGAV